MDESYSPVWGAAAPPLAALRAFDAAVRLGSFRAAASAIALTPSAVSHQVRALERSLGVILFRRDGRGVALTEAGEALAPFVRQGFLAFERGAYAAKGGPRGRQIRVSSLALFSQTVLLPNLDRFSKRWPDYDVRITSTPRFVDFAREDVDLAIRVGVGKWPGLKATELLRITGAPVASPDFLARTPIANPVDLADLRLIHDAAQPSAWRTWLAGHGVERPNQDGDLWLDSAPATLHAAEQGLGVALAIRPLVKSWPGFGERLMEALPDLGGPATRYWLVRPPEADRNPKIRAFAAWLRTACRELG